MEILQTSLSADGVPEMHDRLIVASGLHLQSLGQQVSMLTKDDQHNRRGFAAGGVVLIDGA